MTKAVIRVMQLQANECQRLSTNQQSYEETIKDSPACFRGNMPNSYFDFRLLISKTSETITFCCFKVTQFVIICYGNPRKTIYYLTGKYLNNDKQCQ